MERLEVGSIRLSTIFGLAVIALLASCSAYQSKVQRNSTSFKAVAQYILQRENGFGEYKIVMMDTVTDATLLRFAKRYDIKNVYIHNESKTGSGYLSNTVSFLKHYTPLVGKKTEIIVDFQSAEERAHNPFPRSVTRIEPQVYFSTY